jgi:Phospholipase_D-nuclease N-terminal
MARLRWDDLGTGRKAGLSVLMVVQLALAAAAWSDLARRPADQVNGAKAMWAAVIAVNFIGPLAYFLLGRRSSADTARS